MLGFKKKYSFSPPSRILLLALTSLLLVSSFVGCFSSSNTGSKRKPKSVSRAETLPKLKLVYNTEVQRELRHFQHKDHRFITESYERRYRLYPNLVGIIDTYGLPREILNVALIESGFKLHAQSRAGAVGLWQFMKPTAKAYGLRINYFRDLYYKFKDWNLALAAYNAGETKLRRAIKKAKSNNFWYLAAGGYIPKETARFVPKILAVALIEQNPEEFGFKKVYE